ncbi:tetratricopeptide repeat protein [Synechocystis sp. PCC 7339]|uniref:O-linked N-acetylglucosamine transferase family protein n=1 Tax=Synechocystis sp. PCC 7339 TaxID=2782213 RepID=UPI001CBA9E26|nr:tetratricopeptide repeat protein [Synechocystis sp. PCC 7339]UAJ73053.1 tetratricopeptide repeat protein [Synechocystis sp. PCC 7339]
MATSEQIEQIEALITQESYDQVIVLLEDHIEHNPEGLTYYWYLGLIYVLRENEELAQEIWLSVLFQGTLEEVEEWTAELINFLESKVKENMVKNRLGNAKIIYESINMIRPEYKNLQLLSNLINFLYQLATTYGIKEEYEKAIIVYSDILNLDSYHGPSWYSLSLCFYYLEDYLEAENSIKKVLRIDPSANNFYGLGMIVEKQKNYILAIKAYGQAINLDHYFLNAYLSLANLHCNQEDFNKAIIIYEKALKLFPQNVLILQKLSSIYKLIGDEAKSYFHLGNLSYIKHNYQLSIENFEKYYLLEKTGDIEFYLKLTQSYLNIDETAKAIYSVEKGLSDFPDSLILKRLNQSILPILYKNQEEIIDYRQRFTSLLDHLIKETKIETKKDKQEAIKTLGLITNFRLPYQGLNDLYLKRKYAKYVCTIAKKICPDLCKIKSLNNVTVNQKIHIGYISLRLHALGRLYLGWIKYCNKEKFEVYVYDLSGKSDNQLSRYQKDIKKYSNGYQVIFDVPNLHDLSEKIASDKIQILIIPEIGIDPVFEIISCLRLAPIQCTTWAHPVTSGSPTIDYFLSSNLMEPVNGDEHYSEKLVRLPNLGFPLQYSPPPQLDKKRSDFHSREEAIIYLCSQSLFKYLPQHDYIFAAIASQSKLFQFVFLDPAQGKTVTEKFQERLDKVFRDYGLHYQDYCVFLPRSDEPTYLQLNQLSDIFLDCLSWSGGFTTKDAITCDLPVVTCPGEFMRGRHSYAILKMLGVTETIAETETEYIEIAVRLGLDHEWRQSICDKMAKNKHRLFDDQECVRGLETFFEEAVRKYSKMKKINGDL